MHIDTKSRRAPKRAREPEADAAPEPEAEAAPEPKRAREPCPPLIEAIVARQFDAYAASFDMETQAHELTQTHDGVGALFYAAYHDDARAAAWLIERGADPAVGNRYGLRPVDFALKYGHTSVARVLFNTMLAGAAPEHAATVDGALATLGDLVRKLREEGGRMSNTICEQRQRIQRLKRRAQRRAAPQE